MGVEPTTVYSRLLASDLPSQQEFEYLLNPLSLNALDTYN